MSNRTSVHLAVFVLFGAMATDVVVAQTREKGPWWPSVQGAGDQAGNSNDITTEKILGLLRIPKTGQTYELGRIYEAEMPDNGYRPVLSDHHPLQPLPRRRGRGVAQQDYFTGFIGQMGTQFDAFGHQGKTVRMADGTLKNVYYNGFTQEELTGRNRGVGGMEALGVEHVKPIITRGILIDIAGYKGVQVLDSRYEVTLAELRTWCAGQARHSRGQRRAWRCHPVKLRLGGALEQPAEYTMPGSSSARTRGRPASALKSRAGWSRGRPQWLAPTAAA